MSQINNLLPEVTTALIAVVYPLFCVLTYRQTHLKIDADDSKRLEYYKRTIVMLAGLLLLVFINYAMGTLDTIVWLPPYNIAAIVFSVLTVLFILAQLRQRINKEEASDIRMKMENIWYYLPKTRDELRWYIILSVAAGICEEIIFRYYLYHFLDSFLPAPVSILILNVLFALTHIGTGFQNMISAFILGIIFSVIYYFTGFLIIPVILHSAIEIQTGIIGFRINQYLDSYRSS